MPVDFLLCSHSYRESTSQSILRRRAILLEYLDDEYRVHRRGVLQEVVQKVHHLLYPTKELVQIRRNLVADQHVYRKLFEWLNTEDPLDRDDIIFSPATFAVRSHLEKDGILSWDDIVDQSAQTTTEEESSRKMEVEAEESVDTLASTVSSSPLDEALEPLRKLFTDTVARFEKKLLDAETRILSLEQELDKLSRENASLLRDLDEFTAPALLNGDGDTEHAGTESASVNQDVPVSSTKNSHETEEETDETAHLPAESSFYNATVQYASSFMNVLDRFSKNDQKAVINGLQRLCNSGGMYPSLKSKKINARNTGLPSNAWQSRASREIRFFWTHEETSLFILRLERRSASPIYGSER